MTTSLGTIDQPTGTSAYGEQQSISLRPRNRTLWYGAGVVRESICRFPPWAAVIRTDIVCKAFQDHGPLRGESCP